MVASCGPMQFIAQARQRGPADLDLDDRVGQVAQAHPAPFGRDERAPQAGGPGLFLQVADDVEVRPGADLRLGGQHVVIDEACHPGPGFLDLAGDREVDHSSSSTPRPATAGSQSRGPGVLAAPRRRISWSAGSSRRRPAPCTPVTQAEARGWPATARSPTRSAGWPARPSGTSAPTLPSRSGVQALAMSVSTAPGKIAFALTFGPKAWASPRVSGLRPGFGAGVEEGGTGPQRADRADVDDAAAPGLGHPVPTSRPSRKGPLRFTPWTLS